MPATTTSASALPRRGKLVQEPVQTGHAHVGHQRDLAVPGLGRHPRLLGHGQVARPRRDDDHPPDLGARSLRASIRNVRPTGLCSPSGNDRPEMGRGRRLDPRHQPALLMRRSRSAGWPRSVGRLALAEDHLGKPAANPAVEVDLGESAGIDVRLGADPQCGVGRGQIARPQRHRASVSAHAGSMNLGIPLEGLSPRDRLACIDRWISLVTASPAVRNRFELSTAAWAW